MKIFEYHFNPPDSQGNIFETFIHQPNNIYEKRGGYLFLAGELKKSLPANKNFLKKLNENIKKNFCTNIKKPKKLLTKTLKDTNNFLSQEIKKENVHWLGNLSYAIANINNSKFFFSLTGDIKILLIRQGEITDISQNFDKQEIEPYPLKVFFNIIEGKIAENDLIIIANKDIYEAFQEENILNKLANANEVNEQVLKEIIPSSIKKISGFSLLIHFKKEEKQVKKQFNFPRKKNKKFFRIPNIKIPSIKNKKIIFPLLLILLMIIGLIFRKSEIEKQEQKIAYFQEKIEKTNNLPTKEANLILQDLLKEADGKNKEKIRKKLNQINNLSYISEPKILAEFEEPLKDIFFINDNLYFALEDKICFSEKECLEQVWEKLVPFENGLLVFSEQEKIFLQTDQKESFSFPESNFDKAYSYFSNIYLLNKENCHINYYTKINDLQWKGPQNWLNRQEFCQDIAIDGSIWVLKNNKITRFYQKEEIEKFQINTFPKVKELKQISTNKNIDYLYFLDPEEKRIIVTDKKIKIVKQFQSEKFDNLKKLAFGNNGEIIWLINDNKVYQINLF